MLEYYPDLSQIVSPNSDEAKRNLNLIAVGYLDLKHPYISGSVPDQFIERLELFCSYPVIMTFGAVECAFCGKVAIHRKLHTRKEIALYGANFLRIQSLDGTKIYATTDLILHYITTHNYQPPQEFIDAVLNAPLPGTSEFEKFAEPWKDEHIWNFSP